MLVVVYQLSIGSAAESFVEISLRSDRCEGLLGNGVAQAERTEWCDFFPANLRPIRSHDRWPRAILLVAIRRQEEHPREAIFSPRTAGMLRLRLADLAAAQELVRTIESKGVIE